jgi:hypothetical protein
LSSFAPIVAKAARTIDIRARRVFTRLSRACTTRTARGSESIRCWNWRFRSTVRKQSNSNAAFCKSCPFLIPDQPISATVRTTFGLSSGRCFGTHSSSNTRIGKRQIPGMLKRCDRQLARYAGKTLEELVQRIPALEKVEQCLERHSRSREARRASHNLCVARDGWIHAKYDTARSPAQQIERKTGS